MNFSSGSFLIVTNKETLRGRLYFRRQVGHILFTFQKKSLINFLHAVLTILRRPGIINCRKWARSFCLSLICQLSAKLCFWHLQHKNFFLQKIFFKEKFFPDKKKFVRKKLFFEKKIVRKIFPLKKQTLSEKNSQIFLRLNFVSD